MAQLLWVNFSKRRSFPTAIKRTTLKSTLSARLSLFAFTLSCEHARVPRVATDADSIPQSHVGGRRVYLNSIMCA